MILVQDKDAKRQARGCAHLGSSRLCVASLVLFLVGVFSSSPSAPAQAVVEGEQIAQLRAIKGRMVELFVGRYARSSKQTASQQAGEGGRDAQVATLLAAADGWWSVYTDVNHPDISFGAKGWQTPALLARAWADRGSPYYHSEKVLDAIERGLTHMKRFAYPGCRRPNNWWAWDIGMPMGVIETLILTGDSLDVSLRQHEIDTVAYVLKLRDDLKLSGPASLPLADAPGKTDMNALWHERLCLELAVVVENPAMAGKWAKRAMSEIGRPGQSCLQEDHSYHFHGASPMWAYGRAFLSDYADLIELYNGTVFGPTADQLDRYAEMTLHYVNGFLFRGAMCPAMIGREITRGDDVYRSGYGVPGLRALAALARARHPRAPEILRIIAREREYFKYDPAIAAEQARLTKDLPASEPAPPIDDIFAYPDSDFLQITRPGWAIGIRMHSKRNRGYESINGENLQGWFLSHGSTFHLIDGNEWNGCWPTLDWTRLPGTTVAVGEKGPNPSSFAGTLRVSDRIAMAAMQIQSGGFRAQKSWLVDGNAVICLGSEISGPGRVETTIFNQSVAGNATIIVDGKTLDAAAFEIDLAPSWIWLEGMGYVFPAGQRLHVLREQRSSDWTSVRQAWRHGAGERSSRWYLTGVIAHGENARTYQYIVLPHVMAEAMPALARDVLGRYQLDVAGPHRVVTASGEACVFWKAGSAGDLRADGGCMVWHDSETLMALDPTREQPALHLDVAGQSPTVESKRGRPVSVAIVRRSSSSQ